MNDDGDNVVDLQAERERRAREGVQVLSVGAAQAGAVWWWALGAFILGAGLGWWASKRARP